MYTKHGEPHQRTSSADQVRRDAAHVWHPYTRFSTLAEEELPVLTRGEGVYLYDHKGTRYFDAISSWWCVNLGHGQPAVVEAIQRQAGALQHSILGNASHPPAIELAARLAALMPSPDRHVLFASDGSSAVEQAVKIALQFFANTGRPARARVACLEGAYHGDTLGAMALGYLDHFHRPFRAHLFPAVTIPFPSPENPDDFEPARAVLDPQADVLAAVIVEPLLQGASGMRIYRETWLQALAAWCRANGVLLILDEIATGFGRTGTWFAFQRAGIDPDLICLGKGLSAGYLPLSATIARDAIYEAFTDRPVDGTLQHGHTFCGNPIATAAALAALDLYADGVIEAVPEKGHRLAALLEPARTWDGVCDVRSIGLMTAIEFTPAPPGTEPGAARAHRIRLALKRRGILLRPLGPVLYAMPPLTITDPELAELTTAMLTAIKEEA